MIEGTIQILYHEALMKLSYPFKCSDGSMLKCPASNGYINDQSCSVYRQIQLKRALCIAHSQQGDVMLLCKPQEGSSLGFLSQWFVISYIRAWMGIPFFHSLVFPHPWLSAHWNPRVRTMQRKKIYFSIYISVSTGSNSTGIHCITRSLFPPYWH